MLPRVAEGIGDHFRFNTNCAFVAPCDKPSGTDGWRARGTLTDLVNGGKVRYTEEQLLPCVTVMNKLHADSRSSSYQAARSKYRKEKYSEVAKVPALTNL